jgi:hypothetical protein
MEAATNLSETASAPKKAKQAKKAKRKMAFLLVKETRGSLDAPWAYNDTIAVYHIRKSASSRRRRLMNAVQGTQTGFTRYAILPRPSL